MDSYLPPILCLIYATSISVHPASLVMLPWELQIGVTNTIVARKRIRAVESFLLYTHIAPYLLLASIVNHILVTRKVVSSTKDGITRLASTWVCAFALARSSLSVEEAARNGRPIQTLCLSVFTLMFLQEGGRLESLSAAMVCTSIGTRAGASVTGPRGTSVGRHSLQILLVGSLQPLCE